MGNVKNEKVKREYGKRNDFMTFIEKNETLKKNEKKNEKIMQNKDIIDLKPNERQIKLFKKKKHIKTGKQKN